MYLSRFEFGVRHCLDLRTGGEEHGEKVAFLATSVESVGKLSEVADGVLSSDGMVPTQDEPFEIRDEGMQPGKGRHRLGAVGADDYGLMRVTQRAQAR